MYDGTIYVAGKIKSLGIDCVPGEWTDADTEFDARDIARLLVASQPGSFVYASAGFVGASPDPCAPCWNTCISAGTPAFTSAE